MSANAALAWADALIFSRTGAHLSELQVTILQQVWQEQRYIEIAQQYGCTEGHAKDAGAQLWKLLSEGLGEKVTKRTLKAILTRRMRETLDPHQNEGTNADSRSAESVRTTSNFVGRADAIAHLDRLVKRGTKIIVIQGEGGIGKTTLAQQYLMTQGFNTVLELLMAKETKNLAPVESIVEEWLKRDFNEEPGRELSITLSRLGRHLQTQHVGIMLDNVEPALDRQGRLLSSHRAYVELLRVLANPRNQSVTLMTSRDRLCEETVTVEHYRLPGLTPQAWQNFLQTHQIRVDSPTLHLIHRTYGGNAKAMQIICSVIREDFDRDMVAYWKENSHDPLQATALKNLVTTQMQRLKRLDPDAYRLLCRFGCYRFQDRARIPKAGLLALLWDVEPALKSLVIQSLRNRSLVEFQHGTYWLHPVIRAEAIAQLKQSPDWEIASRNAAEFWTQSVSTIATLADALSAWEAFYHYVDIQDFEAASQVILQSRHNQWQQFLPLGSLLYRMGLLHPVLSAIHQIIDHVQSESNRSELHNILGDLYWTTGRIYEAIACQEKSLETARHCLKTRPPLKLQDGRQPTRKHQHYYFRMLEIDSLLSLGLYHIDLGELETAEIQLQQVMALGQDTDHHRWAEKASVCLALVKSDLGQREAAYALAESIRPSILEEKGPEYMGRFAYFIQVLGQTYTNLGDLITAVDLYERAIVFAEESHYMQIKAKTLSGLAEINRLQGDFEAALPRHHEAIQLLEDIGAKCDLAEAHCQLGLTTAQMGEAQQASSHFTQSIQLFTEIGSTRQVQRVKAIASDSRKTRCLGR